MMRRLTILLGGADDAAPKAAASPERQSPGRPTLMFSAANAFQHKLVHHTMTRAGVIDLAVPRLMLRRSSRRRWWWDSLGLLLVFYQALWLLHVSYETHRCLRDVTCIADQPGSWLHAARHWAKSIEQIGDAFFMLDILVNLRTGYVEPDGTEVVDPSRCAARYLSTWFAVDVLCVLPLDRFLPLEDLLVDEVTGMRRLLAKLEWIKALWRRIRRWKVVKGAKALPKVVHNRRRIQAAIRTGGVARAVQVLRLAKRFKVGRAVKECKVFFSFVSRIWHSQRFVRHMLALWSMRGGAADGERQRRAASRIQAQLRGRLAQNFVLKLQLHRHRAELASPGSADKDSPLMRRAGPASLFLVQEGDEDEDEELVPRVSRRELPREG